LKNILKDDYNYSIIIDRHQSNRIVSIIATKKYFLNQLPWDNILGEGLQILSLSKQGAEESKYELLPKNTNNFYPCRCSGKIFGCIMFAFQICG
jgi:hypothetical protein